MKGNVRPNELVLLAGIILFAGAWWSPVSTAEEVADDVRLLEGHTAAIRDVAFSADGKLLVSADDDGSVLLFDVQSGRQLRRFGDDEDRPLHVRFSPDGRWVVSSGEDGAVRIWDVASGRQVRRFDAPAGKKVSVVISPDGRLAASYGEDKNVRLWKLPELESVPAEGVETATDESKRSWGPEQATGVPDTPTPGDQITAWASATPDGQSEWLRLEYDEPVRPTTLLIHETYNPGALSRVTALDDDGEEIELWKGEDPTEPGSGMGVSKIHVDVDFAVGRVKLYFDSPRVAGWNEIDAVGLVDAEGRIHWATSAEASSMYASRSSSYDRSRYVIRPEGPVVEEGRVPDGAVELGCAADESEDKRSLGGSGHMIKFQRSEEAKYVAAIQIYAGRYGDPQPPAEDFHLYLLDEKQEVIKDLPYPYAMVERSGMRWYTLAVPGVEVPESFAVAVSFNPHRTKGIYLGLDAGVDESHSYTGLPGRGFTALSDVSDWMVRVHLVSEADEAQPEANEKSPPPEDDPFSGFFLR